MDTTFSQQKVSWSFLLIDLLIIPKAVVIFQIVLWAWAKWGFNIFFFEFWPIDSFNPGMVFNLKWTVDSESGLGFSLKKSINKISSFNTPSFWDFVFFYLDLFGQDLVFNLLPSFSYVRSSSKHHFIDDDTYGKIIHSNAMILSAHNFRGHISWSPWSVLIVFWLPVLSDPQICDVAITLGVQNDIFWFNISMNDIVWVKVIEAEDNVTGYEHGFLFREPSASYMVAKITSI